MHFPTVVKKIGAGFALFKKMFIIFKKMFIQLENIYF